MSLSMHKCVRKHLAPCIGTALTMPRYKAAATMGTLVQGYCAQPAPIGLTVIGLPLPIRTRQPSSSDFISPSDTKAAHALITILEMASRYTAPSVHP